MMNNNQGVKTNDLYAVRYRATSKKGLLLHATLKITEFSTPSYLDKLCFNLSSFKVHYQIDPYFNVKNMMKQIRQARTDKEHPMIVIIFKDKGGSLYGYKVIKNKTFQCQKELGDGNTSASVFC